MHPRPSNCHPTRRAVLGTLLAGPAVARAGAGWEWRRWPPGRALPPIDLQDLEGRPWRLADQRGRALLVNFWATWCAPCREEMPSLEALAGARAAAGLGVVTVNYREGPAAIRRFVEALPLGLPVLLDAEGRVARSYDIRIFPTTLAFDRRGRLHGALVGAVDWSSAEAGQRVDALLASR